MIAVQGDQIGQRHVAVSFADGFRGKAGLLMRSACEEELKIVLHRKLVHCVESAPTGDLQLPNFLHAVLGFLSSMNEGNAFPTNEKRVRLVGPYWGVTASPGTGSAQSTVAIVCRPVRPLMMAIH